MKKWLLLLIIILGILIGSCTAQPLISECREGSYDTSPQLLKAEDLSRALESVVFIDHKILVLVSEQDEEKSVPIFGGGEGIVLEVQNKKYVLTCAHVIDASKIVEDVLKEQKITDCHSWSIVKKYLFVSQDYQVLPAKILGIHTAGDFALLELPSDVQVKTFPFKIGNSDDLGTPCKEKNLKGSFVYIFGNKDQRYKKIKWGEVIEFQTGENTWFRVNVKVHPGESGSPVIALRNGKPELVGVLQRGEEDAWVGKINDAVKAIKEETGIDIRGHS